MQTVTFDSQTVTFASTVFTFDLDSSSPIDPILYIPELRKRLQNPAVPDTDLFTYLTEAFRDLNPMKYSATDFDAQVLDTACHLLLIDGKFPEIQSISSGGVSTSFSASDPERYLKRINKRRAASWMAKR